MPWSTPTLRRVREMTRDNVAAARGGGVAVGNNVLRVVSDAMSGLAHLVLRYIDWLSLQLIPDTAETEWLDRHGNIWLTNSDGSIGRKVPELAVGSVLISGTEGTPIPLGTLLHNDQIDFETTEEIALGPTPTQVKIRALEGGIAGNMLPGETLSLTESIFGVEGGTEVVVLEGGTDDETDEELRTRVLLRIRQPPMGGCKTDFVQWALAYPGVTRAWSFPLEMGIGTVTVRFMMDHLREEQDGFPQLGDVGTLSLYLDTVRPVAVKDFFVVAPIPYPINMTIYSLDADTTTTRAAIIVSLKKAFLERAEPGQSWYRVWSDEAISDTAGVFSYDLELEGGVRHIDMPAPGYMPSLGTITYLAG